MVAASQSEGAIFVAGRRALKRGKSGPAFDHISTTNILHYQENFQRFLRDPNQFTSCLERYRLLILFWTNTYLVLGISGYSRDGVRTLQPFDHESDALANAPHNP